MADSPETKALLLKIDASAELLKQNLAEANKHVATFEAETEEKLSLIDKAFETTGERVREHAGEIAAGFAAFFAIEHLVDMTREGLEYAASLGEVAKQLGTNTTALQQFRYAAGQAGIGQEEADKALGKFTLSISKARAGVKEAVGIFNQLGVSSSDLKNLDQQAILEKTADGLAKLKDNVTRAAPEVALFGKTGQQLEPLLSQGAAGINKLAQAASDLGIILTPEQIEKAEEASHKWAELKEVLSANIASFVADNAGAIEGLATSLEHLALRAVAFVKDVQLNFGSLGEVFEPFLQAGEAAFGKLDMRVLSFHGAIMRLLEGIDSLKNAPVNLNNWAYDFDHSHFPKALINQFEHREAPSNLAGDFEQRYRERDHDAQLESGLSALDDRLKPQESGGGASFTMPHPARRAKSDASEEYALAEARAKLATATTAVEQAEAQLDLVRARRRSMKPDEYQAALTSAEQMVQMAKGASELTKTLQSSNDKWMSSVLKDDGLKEAMEDANGQWKGRAEATDYAFERRPAAPIAAYKQQLHDDTDNMDAALQGVAAHGLQSIQDGLVGLVDHTKSAKAAFKEMASSIVADLAKIAVEKLFVSAVGGSFLKFSNGGQVPGFAAGGGPVRGPGTGTSDSILARLSAGEFVMTAQAAKEHLPLLHAMNKGLPGFADGGVVGTMPSVSYPRISSADLRKAPVTNQHFYDLRGAMVDKDVYADMHRIAAHHAAGAEARATQAGADNAAMRLSWTQSRQLGQPRG